MAGRLAGLKAGRMSGRLTGRLAISMAGLLAGLLAGLMASPLAGRPAGLLAGRLACSNHFLKDLRQKWQDRDGPVVLQNLFIQIRLLYQWSNMCLFEIYWNIKLNQ